MKDVEIYKGIFNVKVVKSTDTFCVDFRGEHDGYPILLRLIQWKKSFSDLLEQSWYCGYVGLKEGHPFYRESYDNMYDKIDSGDELTFSDYIDEDDIWWIGFDCRHLNQKIDTHNFLYTLNGVKDLVGCLKKINKIEG